MDNSFIKDTLLPNEQIIAIAKWHWIKNWIFTIIPMMFYFWCLYVCITLRLWDGLLIFTMISLALVFLFYFIKKILSKNDEFAITNMRIIAKIGIIRRIAFELHIEQIESIEIRQGVLGRIMGYGTLIPHGIGASKIRIKFVQDPFKFRQHFYDLKKSTDSCTIR